MDRPSLALVIPLDGDRLHLVEQYRRPIDARSWEFPSGDLDARDADTAAAAARELREETGLLAGTLTPLGVLDAMPSTLAERCHIFLATSLTSGPPDRDPGEHDMRSAWFTRADVEQLIRDGGLTDAKSIAAYGMVLVREAVGP